MADGSAAGAGQALGRVWSRCLEAVLSLVFPEVCAYCGSWEAGPGEGYLCQRCRAHPGHVRRIEGARCGRCGLPYGGAFTGAFRCGNCEDLDLAFESAQAAVVATPFMLDVVHRYKYRGHRWYEPFLGGLLSEAAGPWLRSGAAWDVVVPVPLHPRRRREREFNQAERLAAWLGQGSGLPVETGWVRRRAETETQALLRRADRAQNVARAFEASSGVDLDGRRVVVVDDVLTTGSTTSALARTLLGAGASAVTVWTVARGV